MACGMTSTAMSTAAMMSARAKPVQRTISADEHAHRAQRIDDDVRNAARRFMLSLSPPARIAAAMRLAANPIAATISTVPDATSAGSDQRRNASTRIHTPPRRRAPH